MSTAIYPALFFTVALLVASADFLFGGLPLLRLAQRGVVVWRLIGFSAK